MMAHHVFRCHLSMPGLLNSVRQTFAEVPDGVCHRQFCVSDCLMAGLAMFILKYPLLLPFDKKPRSGRIFPRCCFSK